MLSKRKKRFKGDAYDFGNKGFFFFAYAYLWLMMAETNKTFLALKEQERQ